MKQAIKFILAMLAISVVVGVEIIMIVAPIILTILQANALCLLLYFATVPTVIVLQAVHIALKDILDEGIDEGKK